MSWAGGSPPGAQAYKQSPQQQYQQSPPGAQQQQYASSPYSPSQQQPQMSSAGPVGAPGQEWAQPNSAIPRGTVLATVGAGPTQ